MTKQQRQRRMDELDEGIRVCVRCPLHESRTRAVPGEGPVPAEVFFIGEAPGGQEDRVGRPFVGPSGTLLNRLLETAGLDRQEVYITSCVKCQPPNNRTPHTGELNTCQATWLSRQIDRGGQREVMPCVSPSDEPAPAAAPYVQRRFSSESLSLVRVECPDLPPAL